MCVEGLFCVRLFWVRWCGLGRMCFVVRLFAECDNFGVGLSGGC